MAKPKSKSLLKGIRNWFKSTDRRTWDKDQVAMLAASASGEPTPASSSEDREASPKEQDQDLQSPAASSSSTQTVCQNGEHDNQETIEQPPVFQFPTPKEVQDVVAPITPSSKFSRPTSDRSPPEAASHVVSTEQGLCAANSQARSEIELEEILNILRDGTIESRSSAAERLFNKAADDEMTRKRIASLNVVQSLVWLLYDGKEGGKMYAAYTLSSIITPTQFLVGMRAGVIPALISVIKTSNWIGSKKGAMRALGRLSRSEDAAKEIVKADGLSPIIALLECDDAGLLRRCLVALYFIGADKDKLQAAITKKRGVAPVVRLCRSSHEEVQAEAADVVKVLARNHVACSTIINCGGLEILSEVASSSPSERARISAVKAIQRISAAPGLHERVVNSEAGIHLIIDQGVNLSRAPSLEWQLSNSSSH